MGGRRRARRVPGCRDEAVDGRAQAAERASTRSACSTRPTGRATRTIIRGFGFQGGGGTDFSLNAPGYGAAFKKAVIDPVTAVGLAGFGEVLAALRQLHRDRSERRRQVRHPGARITMSWGENEKKMIPTWPRPRPR